MKFGPKKPFLRTGISEAQKPLPTFAENLGYNGSSTTIGAIVDFADIKSHENRQNRGFAGLQLNSHTVFVCFHLPSRFSSSTLITSRRPVMRSSVASTWP